MTDVAHGDVSMSPEGPLTSVPEVCWETRQAIVDQIRGNAPTTVLGVLVAGRRPVDVDVIARTLGKSHDEVEWTVDVLEEDGLCARLVEEGRVFVAPFAPYRVSDS